MVNDNEIKKVENLSAYEKQKKSTNELGELTKRNKENPAEKRKMKEKKKIFRITGTSRARAGEAIQSA